MSDTEKPEDENPEEAAPHAPIIDHLPSEPPPPPPHDPLPRFSEPEPPIEKVVQRRGGTPLPLTLLFTACLAGGIYWSWSHPKPGNEAPALQPAPDSAVVDLQAKLRSLSDRLDKLENAPPPAPAAAPAAPAAPTNPDAAADLAKRLDDMSAHIETLTTRQDQQASEVAKALEIAGQHPPDAAPPPPDHAAQDASTAQAQQQLADLGSKMDQALSQEKTSLDTLDQRLGKLEQAGQNAEQANAAQAQDSTQIAALDARIGKLEQGEGQIQGATKDATLAVKLEAAQVALAGGQPLGELPGAPPALARFATTAPPTEAALRAQFADASAAILAASRPEEVQKSFFARALARVEQSVTVRRGDQVIVGDPAAGIVARAQIALNNGDLKGAVDALSALSGHAAEAAKPWLAQARALLDARAALVALAAHG